MKTLEETRELIVNIIDNGLPYMIKRTDYTEAFATQHGITLEDIREKRFVPCLHCGEDVVSRLLLKHGPGKTPVYCSNICRNKGNLIRLTKVDTSLNVNEFANKLAASCLEIVATQPKQRVKRARNLDMVQLTMETNNLLRAILEELRHGSRET